MLLFFDIDGTLIDNSHRLPASVPPALEAASRNGHLHRYEARGTDKLKVRVQIR